MSSFDVTARIRAVDEASRTLGRINGAVSNLGSGFSRLGSIVETAAGGFLAITGARAAADVQDFVSQSIGKFTELEIGIARIVAAMSLVGDKTDEMRASFRALSESLAKEFGVSATQVVVGLEALVKAGLEGDKALQALRSALMLAKVEGISVSESANLVVSTLAQFGLSADEASRAVDALANASRLGIGTASQYAGGLSQVGLQAHSMGASLSETLAALVLIDSTQMNAEKSGRMFSEMLNNLVDHQDKLGFSIFDTSGKMLSFDQIILALSDKVRSFSTEQETLNYLSEIFGNRAAKAALSLLDKSDALRILSEKITQAGTAEEMFNIIMNTSAERLSETQARIENLQVSIGEKLTPAYEVLLIAVEGVSKAIPGWILIGERASAFIRNEFAPRLGAAADWITSSFGVMGANISSVFSNLEDAARGLGNTIAGSFSWLRGQVDGFVNSVIEAFTRLSVRVTEIWDSLGRAVADAWNKWIAPLVNWAWNLVNSIIAAFAALKQALVGGSIWTDMLDEMLAQTEDSMHKVNREFNASLGGVASTVASTSITGPLVVIQGSADKETAMMASRMIVSELRRRRR